MQLITLFVVFVCFFYTVPIDAQEMLPSPFGICAHLQGGEEYNQMPQNLQLMRKAGIRWVRTDFSWSRIESPQGTWKFDVHDRIVEETEKNNLQVLGILIDHNVKWARPAYKHLDLWLAYVEKTVSRYKDKIKYWEVLNEPNLERFWHEKPDGANYKILLEATYKKIKEIDPNLVVLYGGTALIPYDFIEKSFEAGAAGFFDIFCIHPYRAGLSSIKLANRYYDDLEKLQTLLTKYNAGQKKIWITEIGWATPPALSQINRSITDTAKNFFDSNGIKPLLDVLNENNSEHQSRLPNTVQTILGGAAIVDSLMVYDMVSTEEEQAFYLPQSLLLSLRFGIERCFLYEFQAPEQDNFDPEEHFGIMHRQLEPKPAFHASAALARVFTEGSVIDTSIEWNRKNFCVVSWTQKNGTRVWAVWSPNGKRQVTVKIGKGLQYSLNHLGLSLPITETSKTLSIGSGVTYLVGSSMLEIESEH